MVCSTSCRWGEIHTFRIAGGARGVERGGDRVLVEILEVVLGTGGRQQLLVFADQIRQIGGFFRKIGQQQGFLHRGQVRRDGLIQPDELAVDQHELVFGVVHGEQDLIRGQAHVDGVNHRADHRDRKHALQVAMAVPVHYRHGVTRLYAGRRQHVGQPRNTLDQGRVAVTQLVTVDDLAGFLVTHTRHQ